VYDDVIFEHQSETDEIPSKKVFGLPLSMDTLVLYYNKDMLNRAKIALPPETWQQFVEQVPKLTLVDVDNNIIQSGAAIGTSNNVPRVMDIISLLMMQNGATMILGNQAEFGEADPEQKDYFPGAKALEFYTSFANPDVEWYSWNADQPGRVF
jgi:ABC-type glycerol-3-phosphate transport system substrate-binding protein